MERFLLAVMAVLALESAPGASAQDIDSLMATMSTRRKVAQLFMPDVYAFEDKGDDAKYLKWVDEGIGGVIIMDGSLLPGMERLNLLQSRAEIPLLVSIDGEWGMSMRFAEFPLWPRQMQLGALRDEDLVYRMGRAVGREMKLIHIGVNFAPVADINVEPANPVINTRSFGEDREKVARFAWAYASGMQDEGVSACVKHFPGHGDTRTDSHKGLPVLPYGRGRLDSLELYPFRYAIDRGVDFVMMGHLSVPALDADGTPTSISPKVIGGLLCDELGFKGMVITDALDMEGVRMRFGGDGPQAALAACKAGADILLMPKDLKGSIDLICGAIARGEISISSIDSRCRRILELKKRQNMFTDEFRSGVNLEGLADAADNAGSRELIAEISRRSLVLVHNRRHALPLNPAGRAVKRGKVAYLALGASGTTLADSLKALAGLDCYALHKDFSPEELEEMRMRLSRYSTVILGFHQTDKSPGKDFGIRPEIYDSIGRWAGRQKLVGVYFGNPYALDRMPWYKDFRAFVIAWDDNPSNCAAAARALCGLTPFEGVLPVSAGGHSAGFAVKSPRNHAGVLINSLRNRILSIFL